MAPRSFHAARRLVFLFLLAFPLAACDCSNSSSTRGKACSDKSDCSGSEVCTAGTCQLPTDGATSDGSTGGDSGIVNADITGITIAPSTPTLDLALGTADQSLVFTVTAQLSSGGSMPVGTATYSVDNRSPGVVDSNGRYLANGTIGGVVHVTATVVANNGTFTSTATLTVRLTKTSGAGSGAGSPGDVFASHTPVTDAAADAEILYPLNGAVMPQNVEPADVQWACSSAKAVCPENDFFRITLTKPDLVLVRYVRNQDLAANDHDLVDDASWSALAQTDPTANATIQVDRWDSAGARVVQGTPVSIRFAVAAITGTVYYWDIDDTTIRAIDDGTSTSRILIPPANVTYPTTGGNCVGCHSISPSGRYMLANTNFDNYGALFDLTDQTLSTASPTPTVWRSPASGTTIRYRLSSWSPDETLAMVSTASGTDALRLIDPFTGATLQANNASGMAITLPNPGTMPAWARDNSFVAFIAGNTSWAGQTTTGILSLLPVVDSAMHRFGTVTALFGASNSAANNTLAAGAEIGTEPTHGNFYPSWTPDSQWIAFANGTSSRSDPRDSNNAWNAGYWANTSALYLTRRDGTGLTRLTRGCAASVPEKKDNTVTGSPGRTGLDFQPNFSPFQGGGYFWLSFLSRRPYGNVQAGNANSAIQPGQIWVMAVKVNPDGSTDPSEVAYWLPGQNPRHRAVSAFWASRPCRQNGDGCSVGSECCGGDCRPPTGGGAPVCSPPDPQMCRQIGQTCASLTDCCGGGTDPSIACTGNVCALTIGIQ